MRAVVFVRDECICNGHIVQEVENVFVELPALGTAAVVAAYLITAVNSSHVGIVHDDGLRARHGDSGAIKLPPLYCARSLGLSAGRHHCHIPPILPDACSDHSLLHTHEGTPSKISKQLYT